MSYLCAPLACFAAAFGQIFTLVVSRILWLVLVFSFYGYILIWALLFGVFVSMVYSFTRWDSKVGHRIFRVLMHNLFYLGSAGVGFRGCLANTAIKLC